VQVVRLWPPITWNNAFNAVFCIVFGLAILCASHPIPLPSPPTPSHSIPIPQAFSCAIAPCHWFGMAECKKGGARQAHVDWVAYCNLIGRGAPCSFMSLRDENDTRHAYVIRSVGRGRVARGSPPQLTAAYGNCSL